jgi:hypothetical protein
MIAAVGFSRMSSQNTPISKEQRIARAKKDEEAKERRQKWVNYMISIRNLIRSGNVEEFSKSFNTNPQGVDAIINRPWTAYPSALHLAVLSKSPEMVSEVVSITSPVNIDYIDSSYSDTPYIEPYTDAEIREALQNFFAVPIKIVTNNNAYFAVKSVPYYKDGEYYFDSSYSYKNEEVWHYDYETFESQISYIRTPKEHINEDDSYQIEAYYPIKKGYEIKGVDVLEDGDLDYFKR